MCIAFITSNFKIHSPNGKKETVTKGSNS